MSYIWSSSSTDGNISASTITNSSAALSTAYSNSALAATEVSIVATYGVTANVGLVIEVLRSTDGGTTFQADTDVPWQFSMPFSTSTAYKSVFTVPASVSDFKINVKNGTGASVTGVTMKTRTATN